MSKIGVVIPTWNIERALRTVSNLREYAKGGIAELEFVVSGAGPTDLNLEPDSGIEGFGDVRFIDGNRLGWPKIRRGPVESMAKGADQFFQGTWFQPNILVFCHDDVDVYEDWVTPLVVAFSDSIRGRAGLNIGLVGFHGAKGLGSDDIYRTPYRLAQLARFNPMSNMVDAEAHGNRVTLFAEVATVDGFFMAMSAKAYQDIGGWAACLADGIPFHMYDSWAAMRMGELGYQTFTAPVSCKHHGGGTEVGMAAEYEAWAKAHGFKDGNDVHVQGHINFYKRFRGQLPVRIR